MINVLSLFPTPVAKFQLGRNFLDAELDFLNLQPMHENMSNTISENRYVLKDDSMKQLREFVESSLKEYLSAILAPKFDVSLRLTQSWVNLTKEGQFHHKHNHPNSFLSGVLYIKANRDKDKICFYRDSYPQIKLSTDTYNPFNSESWWLEVDTGDLLLFPSNLTHMVQSVVGEDRMSLSFNTFPVGYVGEESHSTALHV